MAYIKIDSEGRITAASKTHHCGDDEIDVTIPEEIRIESIHEYRYENGEFIHDPKPVEVIEPQPDKTERTSQLEDILFSMLDNSPELRTVVSETIIQKYTSELEST